MPKCLKFYPNSSDRLGKIIEKSKLFKANKRQHVQSVFTSSGMNEEKEKRGRFLGELSELCEAPCDLDSQSPLAQINGDGFIVLGIPLVGFLASVILVLFIFALFAPSAGVVVEDGFSPQELRIVLVGAASILSLLGTLSWLISRRRIREANYRLGDAFDELSEIYSFLDDHLTQTDRRYPPMVLCSATTTKIMHYFMLVQIREALAPLVREIPSLLEHNSAAATIEALEILTSSLQVSSGAGITTATTIEIPLYNLTRVIDRLTIHLQTLLQQIDAQRTRWSAEYQQRNEPE